MFKVGLGYDVHKMSKECSLVLGGVEIPFDMGLEGHSDADVLIHAVMDSLLGAAGKGDIGNIFPPSNPEFKNISSIILLKEVNLILKKDGWKINNIDSVIVAQAPKMAEHIPAMKKNIARVLDVNENIINIKATTTEGLGFAGIGEGMAAYAVSLLLSSVNKD
ncbi:MAG: 2-C-methyl-D-erythritol 2,4-cyclodiphosphate synthase [Clostridiales bacterium]|nr:2-C-methyl-D-erythritol 2,4-cyclodiphosphate synthase [Clostridiales bacterium]MCF8023638.1 2-C-methyl-D-erythritol 2,4-cyclodiphosphate synthase [Clostridiales bacterium]